MYKKEVRDRLHERLIVLAAHQGEDCPSCEFIEKEIKDWEYKLLVEWLDKAPMPDTTEYAILQEEYISKVVADRLDPIALPPRHARQKVDLSNRQWAAAFEKVKQRLVERGDTMLALLGSRGTGKTQMAVELIRFMARHGVELFVKSPHNLERWAWYGYFRPAPTTKGFARYSNTMDFFLLLRKTYEPGSDKHENDILESFIRPSLLILDEAHDRRGSDWENQMFTYLVDRRYQTANKQTIFIANQSAKDFELNIGNSIADRLQECGGIIKCDWESFRAKGK